MANPNDPISKDSVDLSRQQLGYSQQFTQELQNQVNAANSLSDALLNNATYWKNTTDNISKAKNESLELAEAIKKQFEALKKSDEISSRYAELNEKIKKATKEFNENKQKSLKLEDALSNSGKDIARDYIDGLTARYKLEEKLAELSRKKALYEEAKISGASNAAIKNAQREYIAAGAVVQSLRDKLELVKQVNEGQGNLINHLSGEDKERLKSLASHQKQMDISRNVVNNHQEELDVLKEQTTQFQKLASYAVYFWENIQKVPLLKDGISFLSAQAKVIGIDFQSILNNVLKLDSLLVNFGKSVQVSKDGARILADAFEVTSDNAASYNSNVSAAQANIKQQIEANNALNNSLGTGALFTAKTRLDQIELTKGMGLEANQAARIYQLGSLNQKTAHQTAVDIGDQVVNLRKTTGLTLDYKKVLSDVAKVSGQLAVQYQNNPDLLAKAVIQAQQLGLTLEQTAAMGDKLLDFPASIESELKAELLTGKALNLEQARYYALMGDSAKAAKELMNNVGGIEEFQKLNVLQQRAMAEAIGMQVGELSNALTQQELLKGTTLETKAAFEEAAKQAARTGDYTKLNAELARAANGEELAKQAAQIGNQEKFQMAIEKLQMTIANMVNGPFGKLIDKMATLLSQAGTLKFILTSIVAIIGIKMIGSLHSLGKAMIPVISKFVTLAAEATFTNALITGFTGVLVAAAAAGIGYGIINSLADGDAAVNESAGGGGGAGGGINVPQESSKPIVVEVKNQNNLIVNNRTAQEMNTQNTIVASSKVA